MIKSLGARGVPAAFAVGVVVMRQEKTGSNFDTTIDATINQASQTATCVAERGRRRPSLAPSVGNKVAVTRTVASAVGGLSINDIV